MTRAGSHTQQVYQSGSSLAWGGRNKLANFKVKECTSGAVLFLTPPNLGVIQPSRSQANTPPHTPPKCFIYLFVKSINRNLTMPQSSNSHSSTPVSCYIPAPLEQKRQKRRLCPGNGGGGRDQEPNGGPHMLRCHSELIKNAPGVSGYAGIICHSTRLPRLLRPFTRPGYTQISNCSPFFPFGHQRGRA